ncbi:conserved membrane hypothetical protein [Candidatus Roizmanbacteria bacterium]|nr:conserved membrane hypothetical protein [Candidatus Roizmanbacteria bacterium]
MRILKIIMTNFKKFFCQDIKPNRNYFFLWLFCVLIFFFISILLSNGVIRSDFWGIVLLIVFVIGVISFLAIFIYFFQKLLLFVSSLLQSFQRKVNKRIIIVFISLSILLFPFYWFQIRPSQIKASCQKEADEFEEKIRELNSGKKDGRIPWKTFKDMQQGMKNKYSFCLHRNGL